MIYPVKSQKALKEQLGEIEQEISKEILANDGVIAFTLAPASAAIKQEILNSTPDLLFNISLLRFKDSGTTTSA